MIVDPFQRFLGVPADAEAVALLALGGKKLDRVCVETALQVRLEQVYRHPDGRSEEAEMVRRRLRKAAMALFERIRTDSGLARHAAAPAARGPGLTQFDRYVLAVLVGSGGWNSRSRAQLVALAGVFGVSAAGLMKVVAALSRYARDGGERIGVAEITSGAGRLAAPATMEPAPAAGVSTSPMLARDLAGTKSDGVWATIKLSAVFGLLTIFLGIVALRTFLPEKPTPSPEQTPQVHREGPVLPPRPAPSAQRPGESVSPRLAAFRPLPTFTGNAAPIAAIDAADECPQLPRFLEQNARKLAITDEPSEEVYRSWEVSVETVATGWVRIDESTRLAIAGAIRDVLDETTDAPTVSDRLLEALLPSSGRLGEPVDLWRGAWRAGMLGAISADSSLPAAVVQRAGSQLSVALVDHDITTATDFEAAAGIWLDQKLEGLIDVLEFDERAYDYWEMWIAARKRLAGEDQLDAAVMSAVRGILATATDLARPGRSVNVLGRLLMIADFQASAVVKERFGLLFDDERITDQDLWVLTSLLAQLDAAPWFDEQLVLPPEAGTMYRGRMRDSITRRWPEEATAETDTVIAHGRGIPVDASAAGRWRSVIDRLPAASITDDDENLMERLVIACRINEAATLLAAHKTSAAETLIESIEASFPPAADAAPGAGARTSHDPPAGRIDSSPRPSLTPRVRGSGASVRIGQALGRDGEWAQAYADARRNTEEKLKWLRVLRTTAGSDLGPIDAETFVREVYRGSPQDVRSLARAILVEQFGSGPNVAMEMLDQFPDAPKNDEVSQMLGRLTARTLPSPRSEAWPVEARLAVVEHALSLRRAGRSEIDVLADLLTESMGSRLALLRHEEAARAAARTPQMATELLAEAWRDRAEAAMSSAPVPDDLPGLQRRRGTRRRLAEGPIQSLVADQLTVLDYLTYVTVAEQPALRDAAVAVLRRSADRRRDATRVLQQAVEVEQAITRMWALRMALTGSAQARKEGGG